MTNRDLYWIELSSGELWTAELISDLVSGLVPGYREIDPSEREPARRAYATAVSKVVQQQLLANAIAAGVIDLATIPDRELDRMLGFGNPDERAPWLGIVPLIVLGGVNASWRPPAGNVVVFDARDDGKFVLSLAAIGEIRSLGLISGPALVEHPLGL